MVQQWLKQEVVKVWQNLKVALLLAKLEVKHYIKASMTSTETNHNKSE
jgi:hypothetical protein